ncbi:MAG: hypothetical protein AXA67_11260 [Methylothermaceae bacteria B42]|nr:MAG: hypothetical protein AXA67_11260 [Methylothermaceae bacteria B42]HHJ39110.1 glutathione S-transferase [Methylothermaceae bacterium]
MFDLYTYATPNGQRASIMLEETGQPYTVHWVNLIQGEQQQPAFLKLNPTGRIPVLVDHNASGGQPLVLTQSVAIVQYLAEKTGTLLPKGQDMRARVYEWMQFHATDIGATFLSAFYLQRRSFLGLSLSATLLKKRAFELYRHFDAQLTKHPFLAGPEYTIADVIAFPGVLAQEKRLGDYRHLNRWLQALKQRPQIQRGLAASSREGGHAG